MKTASIILPMSSTVPGIRLRSCSWINKLARAQPQLGLFRVTRTALHVSCLSVVTTTMELDLDTKAEN